MTNNSKAKNGTLPLDRADSRVSHDSSLGDYLINKLHPENKSR